VMLRLLGAGFHARSAADTARRVDDRMQGHRVVQPGGARIFVRSHTDPFQPPAPAHKPDEQQERGQPVKAVDERFHGVHAVGAPANSFDVSTQVPHAVGVVQADTHEQLQPNSVTCDAGMGHFPTCH
jgi:hypothetical protein